MVSAKKYVNESKYLSAKNAGEYVGKKFVIDSVFDGEVGQEGSEQDKLLVRFAGIPKPLPLNQTNLSILILAYGDDTDAWVNHKVTINTVMVSFGGQMVPGIQLSPS